MNLLSVLIIVQFSGVFLSAVCVFIHSRSIRRQMKYHQMYTRNAGVDNEEWPWLIDYFQSYPKSNLRTVFPHFYKTAMATKRYKELLRLKSSGAMSANQFKKKMKKLLPFLNIRQDRLNHGTL